MEMAFAFIILLVTLKPAKGLFRVRPSVTTSLSMAQLRGTNCQQHDDMYSRFMECFRDQCCLAVTLQGECERSHIPTELMDLVKEVNTSLHVCVICFTSIYPFYS